MSDAEGLAYAVRAALAITSLVLIVCELVVLTIRAFRYVLRRAAARSRNE